MVGDLHSRGAAVPHEFRHRPPIWSDIAEVHAKLGCLGMVWDEWVEGGDRRDRASSPTSPQSEGPVGPSEALVSGEAGCPQARAPALHDCLKAQARVPVPHESRYPQDA